MKREHGDHLEDVDDRPRKLVKGEPNGNSNGNSSADKSELSHFIKEQKVIDVLKEKGIQKFFPVQYETFQDIYDGHDLIARDRTGSGKTIAFSLPIIQKFRHNGLFEQTSKPKFLIVLPTRY